MAASQIWQCLDLDLLEGAEFLAEQLMAQDDNSESRYLYGLVLFRQRRFDAARAIVSGSNHSGCIYIYGQCCLELKQYMQGITMLEASKSTWETETPTGQRRGAIPAAAMHLLLGKICVAQGDNETAVTSLGISAKLNPLLWENVALLCRLPGIDLKTENLFTRLAEDPFAQGRDKEDVIIPPISVSAATTSTPRQAVTPRRKPLAAGNSSTPLRTPSGLLQPFPSSGVYQTPPAPMPPPFAPSRAGPELGLGAPNTFRPRSRRSMGSLASTFDSTSLELAPIPLPQKNSFDLSQTKGPSSVLEICARVLKRMAGGRYSGAQAAIEELPEPHQKTRSMLLAAALCQYGRVEYQKSFEAFQELRSVAPNHFDGMEYYSTVLWHLHKDIELGLLAHELSTLHLGRQQWQTWCALGNSFSEQHQQEQALECFHRATQLEPKAAYAFTLWGHEYVTAGQLQSALEAYRMALRADPLHHAAYFGLGLVFLRLGELDHAEQHFSQALRLSPENAVLECFLGRVLQECGRTAQALQHFNIACEMQPTSAVARYHRAEALMEAGMMADAIKELRQLETLAPSEPGVYLALAKAYKALGKDTEATKCFTMAMNLDPKSAQLVNDLMSS